MTKHEKMDNAIRCEVQRAFNVSAYADGDDTVINVSLALQFIVQGTGNRNEESRRASVRNALEFLRRAGFAIPQPALETACL